ncbi:unnamed protein product [Caenorhabditis auriculariae]|uniref:Major facilitator superfamily (MFS) profile domain-containing protein n=1 Tax=Caenorhabditis auriculariae TaxID=2777116 RepID=A0A8S1HQ08_9PELO|nr:unnamed protein product [Caenorhabditis auriculariae]
MPSIRRYFRMLGMEIPLCLYMLGSYLKYPVFQNLIFEKECLRKYDQNVTFCRDVTAYYDDKDIQSASNHFYFISSLVLMVPSLVTTLLLGAATDYWSMKIPLVIPYIGCIAGSVNYVLQSYFLHADVNLLLISDALFGVCGGFIAIISTTLTYGVKTSLIRHRSYRIAGIEGAIGLGGTIGYALSGTIREACGYVYTFVIILALEVVALLYLLILAKESHFEPIERDSEQCLLLPPESNRKSYTEPVGTITHNRPALLKATGKHLANVVVEFYKVLSKERKFRAVLCLNLIAFGVELLIFAGLADIQYSYLRYELKWGDKKYGWFSGLSYGITTATVLLLYPLLRMKFFSDGILGCLGLTTKIASLFMFAFVQNEYMAFSITIVMMFNRFVSTGFRAFISSVIEMHEQGKIFSVISLLEGATSLAATSIFNNVYPKTLDFFPGLLYLISACLLIIPLTILGFVLQVYLIFLPRISDRVVRSRQSPEYSEDVLGSHNDVIDESD